MSSWFTTRLAVPAQPRRRSFWVEDEGEWSLVMAPDDDLNEMLLNSEIHYVGNRLPQDVYYHQEPDFST